MCNNMAEMAVKEKSQKESNDSQNNEDTTEMFLSELAALSWSVVSFEKCVAKNLTYEQAEQKVRELSAQKTSGLCIITDEAAERIKS